ncbi:MAG: M48 family metalloprotease [Lachnospiraceae bacterium]|nr:M48 family metalloprotease [Lachnospiraceae bacterium]
MYLFDFLRRLFRKSNIPVIIYLVINVFIIALGIKLVLVIIALFGASFIGFADVNGAVTEYPILEKMFEMQYMTCFLGGVLVYGVCLFIALSPIGEFIVRWQAKCKVIRRVDQINFIEPIFREVYDKAKEMDPSLPRNVRLFINEDKSPNAFATGRQTICITEGLLYETPDHIKAILAHEFGHLSHKDTDVILVVRVGNLMVNIIVAVVSAAIAAFTAITAGFTKLTSAIASAYNGLGALGGILGWVFAAPFICIGWILNFLIVKCFFGLWTKIGFWLIQLSSRNKEYDADEFSFNCGYGDALCEFLASFGNGSGQMDGLFAALAKSHPDSGSRIAKLQALGATYYENYGGGTESVAYQPAYGGGSQGGNVAAFSAGTATQRRPIRTGQTVSNPQTGGNKTVGEEYTGVVINASKKRQTGKQLKYSSTLTDEPKVEENINGKSIPVVENKEKGSTSVKMKTGKVVCPVCGLEVDNNGADTCGFCGSSLN